MGLKGFGLVVTLGVQDLRDLRGGVRLMLLRACGLYKAVRSEGFGVWKHSGSILYYGTILLDYYTTILLYAIYCILYTI